MLKKYSGGFTAEHLYRNEMKIIVHLQLQGLSKEEIKKKVFEENLLHCRSEAAIKDLFPRVYRRAEVLDQQLKFFLIHGARSDQNALLLYAFLKRFTFPRDFVLEVIHYNMKKFKSTVTEGNIRTFFEEKEQQYEQVRNWTDKTKYKLKQVMLKIIVDAELLKKNGNEYEIKPIPLSRELRDYVERNPVYRDLLILTLNE
ncbi:DUF1819 family protein [Geobacillus sp. FSL K6-0789]|uniref:DUF1819 family protein n=1 Tax=Geobacillus stearothermophilus TaxID=1422 RepID=A0A087LEB1_GEOSE|nr:MULTISPECIES: DUF1819 family protein [Geobacillus]ASS85702.1 hypothetical protein GLN3_00230 [Geobacillus lituanicus]MED4876381.1 DUF1819 family protein [Anoxybacillus geothermalis]KFL15964.1 hypothetical protein ET31_09285 [Geobacillus stearothermophilus]KFX31481.1 hypothetical protein GT94_17885 [Geobacillus stearothermophilus]KMY59908.1 hypothetical protein AA904_09790 [Geobacillus stearothermophilus]